MGVFFSGMNDRGDFFGGDRAEERLFLGETGDTNSAIFDDVFIVIHYVLVVKQIKTYHLSLRVPTSQIKLHQHLMVSKQLITDQRKCDQ